MPRDQQKSYTSEEKAQIEKYAAKNRVPKAAGYFSKLLVQNITARSHLQSRCHYNYVMCQFTKSVNIKFSQ